MSEVLDLAAIDEAIAAFKRGGGRFPPFRDLAEQIRANGYIPSQEAAARFNAAFASDFWRHNLHGGFWWPPA